MKTLFPFLSPFKRTLVIFIFTLFPLLSFASSTSADECPAFSVNKEINLIWEHYRIINGFQASKDSTSLGVAVTHVSTSVSPHKVNHTWGYQITDSTSGANFSYELTIYRDESKKLKKRYKKYPRLSGEMSILNCNGKVIGTVQDEVVRDRHYGFDGRVFHVTVRDENGNDIASAKYVYNNDKFILRDANGTPLVSILKDTNKKTLLSALTDSHYKHPLKWVIDINDPHFDPRIALALGYYVHVDKRHEPQIFY